MKHLTADEIIDFVTMESITQASIERAARVNCHIMQCDECRKKVEAFQAVNDGLMGTRLSSKDKQEDEIRKEEIKKEIELI